MLTKREKGFLKICVVVLLGVIIAVPTLYFWVFHNGLSTKQDDWIAFGTYIGGMFGPTFSLLSILVVFFTFQKQIKMQQEKNDEDRARYEIDVLMQQIYHLDQQIEQKCMAPIAIGEIAGTYFKLLLAETVKHRIESMMVVAVGDEKYSGSVLYFLKGLEDRIGIENTKMYLKTIEGTNFESQIRFSRSYVATMTHLILRVLELGGSIDVIRSIASRNIFIVQYLWKLGYVSSENLRRLDIVRQLPMIEGSQGETGKTFFVQELNKDLELNLKEKEVTLKVSAGCDGYIDTFLITQKGTQNHWGKQVGSNWKKATLE